MNQFVTPKKSRSIQVTDPYYSNILRTIMPRQNGTQAGIDALKASIERGKEMGK